MGAPVIPLWERFNRLTMPEPYSGCLLWIGECNIQTGYGVIVTQGKINGKKYRKKHSAHRISWTLHFGPIPEGLHVLHRCDTRCCVNPNHLFLGTNNDNIRDMHSKERHAHGESVWCSRLTENQVREIRSSKLPYRNLAKQFEVSPLTVWDVQHNKTWKHI